MPANLTPQYHKAEQAFKEAKTTEEKIAALEEMLSVIPKHKGTDHLQGDLRRKLSKLRQEESVRAKSKKSFDPFRVERHGAAQVVVLGPPNSGKSSIVRATTNAPTQVTDFPFATQAPVPGMLDFEGVQIQLVDLPPLTKDFAPGGMLSLIKSADGAVLVCDLSSAEVLDQTEEILAVLEEQRVRLFDPEIAGPPDNGASGGRAAALPNPALPNPALPALALPTLVLANKADADDGGAVLGLLGELLGGRFRVIPISGRTLAGCDEIAMLVYKLLGLIRIFSKAPGKPVDRSSPFVLKSGQTVLDLAARIHRDFPEHLRQARVWGSARFEGQAVPRDHVLSEGDVVELQVDL